MKIFKELFLSTFILGSVVTLGVTDEFVQRRDKDFVLNGKEFKFVGTNNYYLHYKNNQAIDDVFKQANDMGIKVIRMWGFGDGEKTKIQNNFSIQPTMGDYQTRNGEVDGLERMDYSIAQAKKYGIKVILVLTNYWEDFGGMEEYKKWNNLEKKEDFYTNEKAKEAYKNYVLMLLNRKNQYTGIEYKNDPTIFAWELANEPRNPENKTAKQVTEWAKEMSSYIKSIDKNHMVSVGDEGFLSGKEKGYKNEGNWAYDGSQGINWKELIQIPTIDFGTIHLYPEHWGISKENYEEWGKKYIIDHSKIADKYNKPFILEEYGIGDKSGLDRVKIYEEWNKVFFENGGDGAMFWILTGVDPEHASGIYENYDGFRVMNDGTDVPEKLKEIANKLNNK